MNSRSLFLLPGALLLGLVALSAACGDGGEALSLEEYFQRLDAIQEDVDARFEEQGDDEDPFDPDAPLEERVDALTGGLQDSKAILEDAVEAVQGLDPPAEVEDAHDEFVAALLGFLPSFDDFRDRAADVESESDLEELFSSLDEGSQEFQEAGERLDAACLAIQAIADQNNIAVDLNCEEEEEEEQ